MSNNISFWKLIEKLEEKGLIKWIPVVIIGTMFLIVVPYLIWKEFS